MSVSLPPPPRAELFLEADADKSGFLDRKEFRTVIRTADLNLNSNEIRQIMAQCDENDDGVIEYKEFVPIMVELIQSLKAKEEAMMAKDEDDEAARAAAEEQLMYVLPRDELEKIMKTVFTKADSDGNGVLDRKEFKKCLKAAELGLTKKDINILLSETDVDGDGMVTYEEFVPLCFNILVERFKDEMQQMEALSSADWVEQELIAGFSQADEEGAGKLPQWIIKGVLYELSFSGKFVAGLTQLQILTIMSESDPDAHGMVDYLKFCKTAANMIYTMIDYESLNKKQAAVDAMAETDASQLFRGMDQTTVMDVLKLAFQEADADGNGTLSRQEMFDCLATLGTSELGLSTKQINGLRASIDENDDGKVEYEELCSFMLDVLMHLEREEHVAGVAFDAALDELDQEAAGEEAYYEEEEAEEEDTGPSLPESCKVIFVLGGPGSGKGTQCERLIEKYGCCHLSAGDLLRAEVASGSELGVACAELMKEGKLVPVETTLGLLETAMLKADTELFLVDGFPRAVDQALAFEGSLKPAEFVLFMDCPLETMQDRLLKRAETSGRADDNLETIKKRFDTFMNVSMPVIEHFEQTGRVHKVSSVPTPDEVFAEVVKVFEGAGISPVEKAAPPAEEAPAEEPAPAEEAPAAE